MGCKRVVLCTPDAIKPYYGDHALGVSVYLRVRLR